MLPHGCLFTHTTDHTSLWHLYMSRTPGSLTLVSVTTKHISLQWACNKHLSMVELPDAAGQTRKTKPGDLLHLRQGLLLDYSGMEGVSSRIIFEIWTTEAGITTFLWFLVFALWLLLSQWFSCLAQLHLCGRG